MHQQGVYHITAPAGLAVQLILKEPAMIRISAEKGDGVLSQDRDGEYTSPLTSRDKDRSKVYLV